MDNVCPNCEEAFVPRPIRPANDWKAGDYFGAYPANATIKHRQVDLALHQRFAKANKFILQELR